MISAPVFDLLFALTLLPESQRTAGLSAMLVALFAELADRERQARRAATSW